jgi:DNA primase
MHRSFRQEQTYIYSPEQVRRIVEDSGINIVAEVPNGWIMFCPFHNNYRTPAGEMDKQRGHFYCFGCGTSISLLNFVMRTTNKTFFEAIRFIESKKENIDIVSQIENTFKKEPEFVSFDEALIKKLNENAISNARAISYYEKRKISFNSIQKFSLGYSENQDMVTIPIHSPDGKMFVGFVARSIEGKDFKNTPGLPKSKVLFNVHRVKTFTEVYVVESSFDAIRLDQCGVPAVATLGSAISNSQCEILEKYFNNVIVIGDNDDAGRSMQQKILTKIGSRATLISLPSRFNDIGEMEDSDINILKKKIQDPLLSVIE